MFALLTNPKFVGVLAFGLTTIAKRCNAPKWVLNVLPTVVGAGMACLFLLNVDQVESFNSVLATNTAIGLSVTMGYKGLSELLKKTKFKDSEIFLLLKEQFKNKKQ